jgi:hypothetical protein
MRKLTAGVNLYTCLVSVVSSVARSVASFDSARLQPSVHVKNSITDLMVVKVKSNVKVC